MKRCLILIFCMSILQMRLAAKDQDMTITASASLSNQSLCTTHKSVDRHIYRIKVPEGQVAKITIVPIGRTRTNCIPTANACFNYAVFSTAVRVLDKDLYQNFQTVRYSSERNLTLEISATCTPEANMTPMVSGPKLWYQSVPCAEYSYELRYDITVTYSETKPDLVAKSLDLRLVLDGDGDNAGSNSVDLVYWIKNEGDYSASNFEAKVFDGEEEVYTLKFDGLKANGSAINSLVFTNMTSGVHEFSLVVDPEETVAETRKENNRKSNTIEIVNPNLANVVFNSQGGMVERSRRGVLIGSRIDQLPVPTRTGCTFAGWWTNKSGGDEFTSQTIVDSDITLYAHWIYKTYTVTFDANGGSEVPSCERSYGEELGPLPEPSRAGYSFMGWWTDPEDGVKVLNNTPVGDQDIVYYAHWEAVDESKWDILGTTLRGIKFSVPSELEIPSIVTSIGTNVFQNCENLERVKIPYGVNRIEKYAFAGCVNLKEVVFDETEYVKEETSTGIVVGKIIPKGNSCHESIGDYAFKNCRSLTKIKIPSRIKWMWFGVFGGCSSLGEISMPYADMGVDQYSVSTSRPPSGQRDCTLFGYFFHSYDYYEGAIGIAQRRLESTTTGYGYSSLSLPECLSNVVIRGGTSIGYGYFSGCTSLRQITLPSTIMEIRGYAFSNCGQLEALVFEGSCPSVDSTAFIGVSTNCVGIMDSSTSGAYSWRELKIASSIVNRKSSVSLLLSEEISFMGTDGNGAYTILASTNKTITASDVKVYASLASKDVEVTKAYSIKISEDGRKATLKLAPPTIRKGSGADAARSDVLLAQDVALSDIVAKPEGVEESRIGALSVETTAGMFYQASWGKDLDSMIQGEKVQASGDTLYLGVEKQTGKKVFYKVTVSD